MGGRASSHGGLVTWSGRERSSQTQVLPVPGVGLVLFASATPKTVQAIGQKSEPVEPLQLKTDLNGKEASRATTLKVFLAKQEEVSCPQGGSNRKSIMN